MQDRMTEKEQIEEVKKIWHEYGKPIVIAVLIGLAISYGWRYWKGHQVKENARALGVYAALSSAANPSDQSVKPNLTDIELRANQLIQQYPKTVYASLGQMVLAKNEVMQQHWSKAADALQWVVKTDQSPAVVNLAHLNLSLLQQQQGKYQLALDQLNQVSLAYLPMVWQQRAGVYQAEGKTNQVIDALEHASVSYKKYGLENPMINLWLAQYPEASSSKQDKSE